MCADRFLLLLIFVTGYITLHAQQITVAGQPGQLDIRAAGEHSIRVTLKPMGFQKDFPCTPALSEQHYQSPVISLRRITKAVKKTVGKLNVEVRPEPLSIIVTNKQGQPVQHIIFNEDGNITIKLNDQPVLGMGEGGPQHEDGANWRNLPVEYDRRGRYHQMKPRWQAEAYGSRNPAPVLIGTEGWGIFIATPWVEVDLKNKDRAIFIPWKPTGKENVPQTVKNQGLNQGKGLPPIDKIVPGLYDFFVFDAHHPSQFMKDFSVITGPAKMPPKWALGYMQSHRTLENEKQMIAIVDTFRSKKIPVDAVIYLGTGFTPRGWNKQQPSFEFNPEIFLRDPKEFFTDMHNRNVKVILHIVPWDRDKLPTLHGSIPPKPGETPDISHIQNYWKQHVPLLTAGADGFWPDEGDWFNLFERIKRHQLYYQGSLSANPNLRPWSLHRNGFPGIAQWGGWVWSGDPESSWKTLEAQIAVGINHSLSLSPFWGSDIGGFRSSEDLTGELYARWFQFGAFNALFRSHGQTWWTRLPWGWGLSDMGPKEGKVNPLQSEMNNKAIEPVTRKYDELRYQLLPYNYTLAWEARHTGMPMMRAMWLHYPDDVQSRKTGDQYLWGRDMLIAPVYEKGAVFRNVYLPAGVWYDWWTNKKEKGGKTISRNVDLSIMPIYVRAGAIIPFDPIRQFTGEQVKGPTTLKVFRGADGQFTLYDDDGISQDYLKGKTTRTSIRWNEKRKQLTISPGTLKALRSNQDTRTFTIQMIPDNEIKTISYNGQPVIIKL
ncbi:MAG: hypothetical protein NVS3B8_08100 [Chitinophagaceae bacterium]